MFNKYFQDELTYLRDLGKEFASAYPGIGPMLAERGGDPDVERLLEGVAFLTGKIRQKIDDELPVPHHSGYVTASEDEPLYDHQKLEAK